MIKPTVGRIVWYRAKLLEEFDPKESPEQAAMIVKVHDDRCVNLVVFGHDGSLVPATSVPLVEAAEPPLDRSFCHWPPIPAKKPAAPQQPMFARALLIGGGRNVATDVDGRAWIIDAEAGTMKQFSKPIEYGPPVAAESNGDAKTGSDLPRWQCHKQVSADRIVEATTDSVGQLFWVLSGGTVITVSEELANRVLRALTAVGGFYVRYDDGFESWSPSKAFEDGYTRLP